MTRLKDISHRFWLPALVILALIIVVLLLIWPGWAYQWPWTGFEGQFSPPKNKAGDRDYYPSKQLWDWMQLLLIPLALAIAGFLLNRAQQGREQAIARNQEQEAALQTYLSQIAELLLNKNLRDSQPDDEVRHVARAQTLTALRRLDGARRAIIIQFLHEAGLIGPSHVVVLESPVTSIISREEPIIILSGADLRESDLNWAQLDGAELAEVDLRGAKLGAANLDMANLRGATLCMADLRGARLGCADLNGADLTGAKLERADLRNSDLRAISMEGADLRGTRLQGAQSSEGALRGADLTRAELDESFWERAKFSR